MEWAKLDYTVMAGRVHYEDRGSAALHYTHTPSDQTDATLHTCPTTSAVN